MPLNLNLIKNIKSIQNTVIPSKKLSGGVKFPTIRNSASNLNLTPNGYGK